MTYEEEVLKELKDINEGVHANSLSLARVEGDIQLHTSQIDRNTSDIAKNSQDRKDSDRRLHQRIEKVDGKLNSLLIKVTGAATAAGAAAGSVINAILGRNGG
jgi:hypothetical protein